MKHTRVAATGFACALAVSACSKPPPDPDDVAVARRGGSGGGASTSTGGSSGGNDPGGSPGSGGSPSASGGGSPGSQGGGGSPGSGGSPSASGGASGGSSDAPVAGDSGGSPETPPGNNLPPGVLGHPDPAVDYPKYPGFSLALAEEFASPLDLDKDPIWTWSDGGLKEGFVRFAKEGISFRDGKMVLTASKQNMPGSASWAEPLPEANPGKVDDKILRSGEMRTKFNNFRYGRYEVRMKPPVSNGNFLSTMFIFRTPKWEEWREIDIEVTADKPGSILTNVISGENAREWRPDIADDVMGYPKGPGAMPIPAGFNHQTGFHTYAFEWLPNQITWFVDGVPVRVEKDGASKRPVPKLSAKIIMNLWIFESAALGGDPSRNVYPMSAEYEWFRYYKWDQETTYPCKEIPNCLPAADRNFSKNNPNDGLPQ